MDGEIPANQSTGSDSLAINDPDGRRTTVREVIGLFSVVAWRFMADLYDSAGDRLNKELPDEARCHEIGSNLLCGLGVATLAVSVILHQDPTGL